MKISEIDPPVEHHAVFELCAINRLTDCSGCYCLTNARGDILFAGQAASVRRRVLAHYNGTEKETITIYGRIARVWWRLAPAISLSALEIGWQKSIRSRDGCPPPLNRVGRSTRILKRAAD